MVRFIAFLAPLLAALASVNSVSSAPTGLLRDVGNILGTVTTAGNGVVNTTTTAVTSVTSDLTVLLSPTNVLVSFTIGIDNVLGTFSLSAYPSRGEGIAALVDLLKLNLDSSLATILGLLTDLVYEKYWITNQILIKNCPAATLSLLAAVPGVLCVLSEPILPLPTPDPTADSTNNTATAGWGQAKINAPNVWSSGNTGQNVIVATIDSGVRGTHEALRNNFVGSYGWYDPKNFTTAPIDDVGHGTHTMGSIAGANGIGVAPGAKWMACKGCSSSGCATSLLLACGQFMLCPTDTSGNNRDCSKAPHVVSNSWGGGRGLTYFQSVVNAWSSAGIIPVFANGNSGSTCATDVSPGDATNVLAVGASDINDALGSFSSRGPAANGAIKPDLTAPGVSIRSAWNTNDVTYQSYSGTSMAAPQVAGAVALLLSARPGLGFDAVKNALAQSAVRTGLPASGGTCGGTPDSVFPNNQFGYGRINAQAAVSSLV